MPPSDHSPSAIAPDDRDQHQHVDVEHARTEARRQRPAAGVNAAAGRPRARSGSHASTRHGQPGPAQRGQRPAGTPEPQTRRSAARRSRRRPARGFLVLEPRAHAGLRDGFGDARRRQLRGVVLDAQPLADDVGVERLEAGQPLQAALEDRDFFVAVHALDAEDRFGVQLQADSRRRRRSSRLPPADRRRCADRRLGCRCRRLLDVRDRLLQQSTMCWSSSA